MNDKAFLLFLENIIREGNEDTNKEWLSSLKTCIGHLKNEYFANVVQA